MHPVTLQPPALAPVNLALGLPQVINKQDRSQKLRIVRVAAIILASATTDHVVTIETTDIVLVLHVTIVSDPDQERRLRASLGMEPHSER